MARAKHDSITRRSLFGALAVPVAAVPIAPVSAPALAAPGFATAQPGLPASPPPDPIFAAIEEHRRAYAALDAFVPELADAEQAAWHAPRGKRRVANRRLKEAYAEERRLGDIVSDTADRFAATVPDTLPGAAAALAYVRAHHAQGYPMCDEQEDVMTLLASSRPRSAARRDRRCLGSETLSGPLPDPPRKRGKGRRGSPPSR